MSDDKPTFNEAWRDLLRLMWYEQIIYPVAGQLARWARGMTRLVQRVTGRN